MSPITLTRNSGTEAGAGTPTADLPPWLCTHFTYSSKRFAGVPPDAAKALTKVANPATGTKSRAGSKPGFFVTSGRIEIVWSCEMKKVVPSGAAAFSACAASWPPAPGRFSTITGAPSASFSLSESRRAMASVPPPAGKPTRILTVLPAWASALVAPAAHVRARTTPASSARRRAGCGMGPPWKRRPVLRQRRAQYAFAGSPLPPERYSFTAPVIPDT